MRDSIDGEHVGAIEEKGDAAETFRLALGAIGTARKIKPRERSIGLRVAERDELEREGLRRDARDGQRALADLVIRRRKRLAVERHALESETFAVEHERLAAGRHFGIRSELELGGDAGRTRREPDVKLDLPDQVIGGGVIFQQLRLAG